MTNWHQWPEGGRFKKGQRSLNWRPVGSETINDNGFIMVKVAEPDKWRPKHHLIWEAAYGPLPHGEKLRLRFKDGDKNNLNLDNLERIVLTIVGTERMGGNGFIEVKVSQPNKWRFKHLKIWEDAYGPIPKGYKLFFLDGDFENVCLENLALFPRNINQRPKKRKLKNGVARAAIAAFMNMDQELFNEMKKLQNREV